MDTNSENVVEVKDKVIERVKVFDKKKLAIIIPIDCRNNRVCKQKFYYGQL